MKVETLEKDLKFPIIIENGLDYLNLTTKIFKNGAKWQKERSYSEEEVKFAYEQGARLALISQSPLALNKGKFPTPDEWFEQFKK